jgi:chromatin segregation and condensation protein Rec8/ScpA/Scc1 (kleisin family)
MDCLIYCSHSCAVTSTRSTSCPSPRLPASTSPIKEASGADVELGADFLETASWLVLLKSRAMLPQTPNEVLPGQELERALLDHETVRATAGLLRSRIDAAGVGPGNGLAVSESGSPVVNDERVRAQPTVQDALLAARRALAVARAHCQR